MMPETQNQPLFGQPAVSPASLAYRRALALELMKQGMSAEPIRSPWQGVGRIVQSIVGGWEASEEDKSERKAREGAASQLLAGLLSSGMPPSQAQTASNAATNPWLDAKIAELIAGKTFPSIQNTGMTLQPTSQITGTPSAPYTPRQEIGTVSTPNASGPTVVGQPPPGQPAMAPPPQQPQPQQPQVPLPPRRPPRPLPPAQPYDPANTLTRQGFNVLGDVEGNMQRYATLGRELGAKAAKTKANVDALTADMEASTKAPGAINALGIIENIANTHPMARGVAGEPLLRLKQSVNGLIGKDVLGDTSGPEVYKKMNIELAREISKAMSARGATNFDFAANMENLPGNLMMSERGTLAMTDILKQMKRQELGLGKLAQGTTDFDSYLTNRQGWLDQKENQIINPLTRTAIGIAADTGGQIGANLKGPNNAGWKIKRVP
jgi:hypothetical protein